jgi:hypothetical protein
MEIAALRECADARRVGQMHLRAASTPNQPREALIEHAREAVEIFSSLGDRYDAGDAAALLRVWEASDDATVAEIVADVAAVSAILGSAKALGD